MKNIYVFIIILLVSKNSCKAQNNIVDYNKIYVNNISIATFKPNDFINSIGSPSSIYVDDMGFNTDVYKKNENRFNFYKNYIDEKNENYNIGDLISFDIMDSTILVKINNTTFKVGDNIAILKTVFPKSFNNNTQYETIMIGFRGDMNGGSWISDNRLNVKYDKNTEKIIRIELYYAL